MSDSEAPSDEFILDDAQRQTGLQARWMCYIGRRLVEGVKLQFNNLTNPSNDNDSCLTHFMTNAGKVSLPQQAIEIPLPFRFT